MMKSDRPGNPFNGDSRVACSPQHGVSGTEAGKAIYRLGALDYYVERSRRRYVANLKLPGSWLVASAMLLLTLLVLVLAGLWRVSVATPAVFTHYPQAHASGSAPRSSALLLPADAAKGLELRLGAKLNCRIKGREEALAITDAMKLLDVEAASRELGISIDQIRHLGNHLLVVGIAAPIESVNDGDSFVVIRPIRLIHLLH